MMAQAPSGRLQDVLLLAGVSASFYSALYVFGFRSAWTDARILRLSETGAERSKMSSRPTAADLIICFNSLSILF